MRIECRFIANRKAFYHLSDNQSLMQFGRAIMRRGIKKSRVYALCGKYTRDDINSQGDINCLLLPALPHAQQ